MATIRKRGDSYQIRVSVGYDTKGNHKEQAMTWKPEPGMTQRQIEKELNRQAVMFEESVNHGFKTSAMKFQELAEEWFENYAKNALRSTTYERMLQLTHRVYPAIGHLRIDKITARHLQGFVNSLAKEGANEKTGKPLAPKTIRHNLSFISDVFSYAVRMELISDNPCSKVVIPKGEVKEKQIYSQEEMELLLTRIMDEPVKYKAFFFLIAYSGFRRSEMLSLEWKDIDFQTGVIHIQRTSNYTKTNGIYTDTTKTESSVRFVKVPMEVIDVLLLYKEEQDEERIKLGSKWHDTDRLFVKYDGQPMNPQTPYGWLKEFCEKNDFPFYGIHQFRHLHTSLLIGAGIDPTTVSSILGHSQVSTTLNLYSHMLRENQIKACDAVANALSFTAKDNPETKNPHHANDTESYKKIG
mgnify:CR=1 FL=1